MMQIDNKNSQFIAKLLDLCLVDLSSVIYTLKFDNEITGLIVGWHELGSEGTSLSQFRWNDRTIRYTNISSQMVSRQSVLCTNRMDGPFECDSW